MNEIKGTQKGSLVHRFITAGKPGNCSLCDKFVEKLEAHHIQYDPEIIIKLCHACHHKVHFWPNRLNEFERFKLLEKRFSPENASKLCKLEFLGIRALAKLIAPSRNEFIRVEQSKEIEKLKRDKRILLHSLKKVNHSPEVRKVNKVQDPGKIKVKKLKK